MNHFTQCQAGPQCAGKKSGEESRCNLPSEILTLLILFSHQCNCSSFTWLILNTLDTNFRSIKDINISISSSSLNLLLFLKHFPVRRRSFTFDFFCATYICRILSYVHPSIYINCNNTVAML